MSTSVTSFLRNIHSGALLSRKTQPAIPSSAKLPAQMPSQKPFSGDRFSFESGKVNLAAQKNILIHPVPLFTFLKKLKK